MSTQGEVVVRVEDAITVELGGHEGCHYACPPQPRDEALALIGILLGRRQEPAPDHGGPWSCAIAGGRRTITLEPVAGAEGPEPEDNR